MGMMDVSCSRCGKSFRVRAEFAGRSTRCPGCSAPLLIGGEQAPPPPVAPPPIPKRRKKIEPDEPIKVSEDWRPAEVAIRREKTAILFALAQLCFYVLGFCFASLARSFSRFDPFVLLFFMLILLGPSIGAAVLAIMARMSACRISTKLIRSNAARSSLYLSVLAVFLILAGAFAIVLSLNNSGPPVVTMFVFACGLMSCFFGAVTTFVIYLAQIGIRSSSKEISQMIARLTNTGSIMLTLTIVIVGLVAFFSDLISSGNRYREPDLVYLATAVMVAISQVIVGLAYYQLLGGVQKELKFISYERSTEQSAKEE